MIFRTQLRELVEDVLKRLDPDITYSVHARNLILGTIAQESHGGKYIKQIGGGPALGICQMEPATMRDIYTNFLHYKHDLTDKLIAEFGIIGPDKKRLWGDLIYQIVLCRIQYFRVPERLPLNLDGYAAYWKKYYNTVNGAGTEGEFTTNYLTFVT